MSDRDSGKYGYPHGNLLYRKLHHDFVQIVAGKGIYLYDQDGREIIDACSGAMVANLGHGNREITERMAQQAQEIAYLNGLYYTHPPAEMLAQKLCEVAPPGLDKVLFMSSGTEATEAAIKLVRQYWLAQGKRTKHKIIGRLRSYHGGTLGAIGLGARKVYKNYFKPLYIRHPKIPAPICYHCPWGKTFPQCEYECAQELELAIDKLGAQSIAAFIAEPILGANGVAMVPPKEYYPRIQEICRKHEILFIADEILSGMGRTGDWFAISSYGVSPDVLLAGKGMAGGYIALSAMMTRSDIIDTIRDRGDDLLHAQTFSQHPVACAAGVATIEYMQEHRVLKNCRASGELLHARLHELKQYPVIGDIRGRGLLAGIEFVADRESRMPFPRSQKFTERFCERALANGLNLWRSTGHIDGINGDGIILAPPLITTSEEIEMIISRLESTLKEVKT